jgi:membrane-associated protease RseP (regulator of RpoE activity)
MLDEPSVFGANSTNAPSPVPAAVHPKTDQAVDELQAAVADVMDIYEVNPNPGPPASVGYRGRLRIDSEQAYTQLDAAFERLNYHVILTTDEQGMHLVMALKGRIRPKPRPWWPNALLFVLTVFSLLYVGAAQEAGINDETEIMLWKGWPYALSMILILGSHELGHYFAARRHHVNVTLPYFIPLPFGFFGTLGAFIQLREPMRNRKILFDVGVAGPLVGLAVAVPILIIGLATSPIEPLPSETYALEGNSVLYAAAKLIIFGEFLPNGEEDVFINQLAKAGWTGLFITGLNLIPLGQLDGGHVVFTLLGRQAQRLYLPILAGFLVLSFYNSMWILWTLLLFILGRVYAVPLDNITQLDNRRRWIGYLAIIIFVVVFVPNPLQLIEP